MILQGKGFREILPLPGLASGEMIPAIYNHSPGNPQAPDSMGVIPWDKHSDPKRRAQS